jgi:pyruvate/2-oxoglutarate/acetoin dehydrogenase E1 component
MKYLEYVNSKMKMILARAPPIVIYGQNINAGSCISGYTRGLKVNQNGMIINSTNSENTLAGVGFGLMMAGANAIFYMKQLDFLLLGIDQIVNTFNIVRTANPHGSYSIMPLIVDAGYDGPQSSLNTLADFCSIASCDGYSLTNKHDIDHVLENFMIQPGFRIIAFSQRLMKSELLAVDGLVEHAADGSWFQYLYGADLTIACFNLSLPQGMRLSESLRAKGLSASLFSVNSVVAANLGPILKSSTSTSRLLILDDTKSYNSPSQMLAVEAMRGVLPQNVRLLKREFSRDWFQPSSDEFLVDTDKVIHWLKDPHLA